AVGDALERAVVHAVVRIGPDPQRAVGPGGDARDVRGDREGRDVRAGGTRSERREEARHRPPEDRGDRGGRPPPTPPPPTPPPFRRPRHAVQGRTRALSGKWAQTFELRAFVAGRSVLSGRRRGRGSL